MQVFSMVRPAGPMDLLYPELQKLPKMMWVSLTTSGGEVLS